MGRCRRLRGTMRAKPAVVKGAVRVHFGARSDLGSWPRWSRRKARNSSPRIGWVLGVPCLTLDVQGGRFELDLLPPQVHALGVRNLACSAVGDPRRRKRMDAGDYRERT